jgi:hypothetical protein
MMTDVDKINRRIHAVSGAILAAIVVVGMFWCAWILFMSITGSAVTASIGVGCSVVLFALIAAWMFTSDGEDWD